MEVSVALILSCVLWGEGPVVTGKPKQGAAIRVEAAVSDKTEKGQAYVNAPQGLFPSPLHPSEHQKGASRSL